MSQNSSIEWTDTTWNPVRGCTKVSPGCAHCYAETFAERFRGVKGHAYEQGFDLRLVPEKLNEPLSWRKPRRVFVNSMSDLFQDGVPDEYIDQVFAVMTLATKHTFQVLTKRADRMQAYLTKSGRRSNITWARTYLQEHIEAHWSKAQLLAAYAKPGAEWDEMERAWPLPNVWLGVSVENQHFADERIPLLLQTPAAVRFISAEPLLGPVDLAELPSNYGGADRPLLRLDALRGGHRCGPASFGPETARLDWVIVGGESGHGARPFAHEWARSIITQCKAAKVAVFLKQLGSHDYPIYVTDKDGVFIGGTTDLSGRRSKGNDMAEWPEDLRVREFPQMVTA